uniref:Putative portal protein n=1 Tax=viral metagenome TaxID=1070528 RepID=A0A6M3LE63_9ZZZZ
MVDTINSSSNSKKDNLTIKEVKQHHDIGFQETERRSTGKNRIGSISFNEADELFRSWIDESKWPYDALLFDPRIFTFISEKASRLISNKPQGKLIPREGSNQLAAKINNELLSYQWDQATQGGSMLSKWALMDMNTRKYGSSFAIAKWRYELDSKGIVVFDGPEMQILNNRDIAHDLSANSIENCNWFQARQYVTIQDLKNVNDQARQAPIYRNLDKLKAAIQIDEKDSGGGGDSRSVNWTSRNRAIAGLEQDPVGKDDTFKTVEIVTEYRRDRWITFAPKHGVVIRDIDNPYKNNQLPIVMLRYYQIDDDLYGLSEIEPVKGLQKALNALLCQYVDEINQKLYSPIAVGPGVRQHTLEWGKGARWIMNNPMTDFRLVESRSNAAQFFNNTYSVLVSAMMNALGESSLGTSNIQPFQKDKTATEVKALQLQRNSRDNFNQIFLSEAIERQYMLWHTMNQVLLFSDPKTTYYMIRISGADAVKYFSEEHLADPALSHEKAIEVGSDMDKINDVLARAKKTEGLDKLFIEHPELEREFQIHPEDYLSPQFPINKGTKQKPDLVPKLEIDSNGKGASLAIEPDDINGSFDFSIDVQSMQVSADEEKKQGRQQAISLFATNPNITQMLAAEGVKPKFKELFVTWLEDVGFDDASRFFEAAPQGQVGEPGGGAGGNIAEMIKQIQGGAAGGGAPPTAPGTGATIPPTGIPGGTNPNKGGENSSTSPFSQEIGTVSPKAVEQLG